MLIAPFSEEEVGEALGLYDSSKNPRPDGFNFRFLKEFWEIYIQARHHEDDDRVLS